MRLVTDIESAKRLHLKERTLVGWLLSVSGDITNVVSIECGKCQEYLLFVLGNEKTPRKIISRKFSQ
jgi:hypothetical protein